MPAMELHRLSKRKILLAIVDQFLSLVAIVITLNLIDSAPFSAHPQVLLRAGPLFAATGLLCFTLMGFYSQVWRFASLRQYAALIRGVIVQVVVVWIIDKLDGKWLSNQFFIVYGMTCLLAVSGIRILFRVAMENEAFHALYGRLFPATVCDYDHPAPKRKRMIVIGAGPFGSQIIREMQLNGNDYLPVAIIDDNPALQKSRILGVPVFGGRDTIPEAVRQFKADGILLAAPETQRPIMRELFKICNQTGCELKTMPSLSDVLDGKLTLKKIKSVEIDDLLGREEIVLDTAAISGYIRHAVVLVTGGGGSIGSELCRQIAGFMPRELIIFDIYENNAYSLMQELKGHYGDFLNVRIVIGSVRDRQRLRDVFRQYLPDVVFHAAAHKHVPLMEDSMEEAVKNNIFGTLNTAEEAAEAGVLNFVAISTDKAVNPTSVMGASKRFAELIIQTLAKRYPHTRFAAVRFGNVLGSNGSVIPLFRQQILNNRCVTVTHPNMTRFFMTIPEAARLVIQAGALASDGDIFVLDMGEPVKIDDLARVLIRLSGLEPDVDVQIRYVGLRPGEKMYEELYLDKENLTKSSHDWIYVLKPISDRSSIASEIDSLCGIIHWDNPKFGELIGWLKQNYPERRSVQASAQQPAMERAEAEHAEAERTEAERDGMEQTGSVDQRPHERVKRDHPAGGYSPRRDGAGMPGE